MPKIWVYVEIANGKPDAAAREILTRARSLDAEVSAVVLGPGATDAASGLGRYGAATVYASDDPVYDDYIAQPAAHALHELAQEHGPDMVLFATNYDSRDIAGRLSAKMGAPLMSNATDVTGPDTATTAAFGGQTVVDVKLEGPLNLVLVRPKSFDAEPSDGDAEVISVEVQIPDEMKKAKRVERHAEETSGPKLEEASVVIAGGRGLGEAGNFKLLDDLATAIGNAAVGATRAVVDAGWVPYAYQIGQTGATVKPDVYLAFGISGATQHVVGMKGAGRIVAVNKDEDAPIFSFADVGVVGDALKVLPQLIEEVRRKGGA